MVSVYTHGVCVCVCVCIPLRSAVYAWCVCVCSLKSRVGPPSHWDAAMSMTFSVWHARDHGGARLGDDARIWRLSLANDSPSRQSDAKPVPIVGLLSLLLLLLLLLMQLSGKSRSSAYFWS